MIKVKDIFDYLNMLAPVELKMDFDNVGLLVGDSECPVNKCIIALDITDEVIEEAVTAKAELIISHHPIIFGALKSVTANDLTGRKVISLVRNNISALCMHTNLDIAEGGVNDALMKTLDARTEGFLEYAGCDNNGKEAGCGRIGTLENEMQFDDFLGFCKERLKANGLRYYKAGDRVKNIAVMGGAGGSSVALAKSLGCDTFVTSDIKYNNFLDAKELGINLIDADHFCTENVVVQVLLEELSAEFPNVSFFISKVHKQTIQFF